MSYRLAYFIYSKNRSICLKFDHGEARALSVSASQLHGLAALVPCIIDTLGRREIMHDKTIYFFKGKQVNFTKI